MQMMYDIIYKALVETGLENRYEPHDFLNFFCLGNREVEDSLVVRDATASNTPQVNRPFQLSLIFQSCSSMRKYEPNVGNTGTC